MALTKKTLMGGDKMRPGGVRTMQDEIDMGIRDKDGNIIKGDQNPKDEPAEEVQTPAESPVETEDQEPDQAEDEDEPEKTDEGDT